MTTRKATQLARFTPRGIIPTDEQLDIQMATSRIILIEANAGAAKTTTLAMRIGEAIARQDPPESILALVFTPEAAIALKNALLWMGVSENAVGRMIIETFEGFAHRALTLIGGEKVQYLPTPEALKPKVIQAMAQVFEKFSEQYELDEFSLGMNNVAVDEFLNLQLSIKAKMLLSTAYIEDLSVEEIAENILGISPTLYLLFQEYERSRMTDGVQTVFRGKFDAIYDLARLIEENPDYINSLPEFKTVLADELHDLNEATFKILSAILNRGNTFFCGAGDKDQVIYSWAGADPQFLQQRFKQAFTGLLPLPLTKTFRHGPHLAEAIATFKNKENTSGIVMKTQVSLFEYDGEGGKSNADRVVEAVNKWIKDNGSLGSAAILIRSPYQSIEIENALFKADIGYKPFRMESYLQRQEILLLRGVLSVALNNFASIEDPNIRKRIVDALITFAQIVFDKDDPQANYRMANEAQESLAEYPELISQFFLNQVQLNGSNVLVKDAIASVLAFLKQCPPDAPAGDVLQAVFETLKLEDLYKRIFVSRIDAADASKSVHGFIQAGRDSGKSLEDFSHWLNKTEQELFSKKWQHTITLCLVDDSKGLEFDHVIIPGLSAQEFPKPGQGKLEEENRFYVAATRAKQRLTLIAPSSETLRSRFVGEMQVTKSNRTGDKMLRGMVSDAPNVSPEKTYLNAGYDERITVKELGARYDGARKKWYVLPGCDLEPFKQWIS